MTIPGVGPVTASAIVATIQDEVNSPAGASWVAFLGLNAAPELDRRQKGGRRITKMGDRYLRKLLVARLARRFAIAS